MARPKQDLSALSINQLEELTGSTFRTIKKVLKEAGLEPLETTDNSILYNPTEALPIIFQAQGYKNKSSPMTAQPMTEEQERAVARLLDPAIQKARKDRAQADKSEFELEVLKQKYVPAEEVELLWSNIFTNFRSKCLSFSQAKTPQLHRLKDIKEFQTELDLQMRELLEELSSHDHGWSEDAIADTEDSFDEDDQEGETASEDLGE